MDDRVDGDEQQCGDAHAEQAGTKPDDKGLCVKDLRHVAFGGADGAQDTDLLGPFQNGNIRDDSDHDGRDDERYGDKSNQHIGDDVDDGGHGGQ